MLLSAYPTYNPYQVNPIGTATSQLQRQPTPQIPKPDAVGSAIDKTRGINSMYENGSELYNALYPSTASTATPVASSQLGTMMSDGSIFQGSIDPSMASGATTEGGTSMLGSAAPYLGGAQAAYGGYKTINALQNGGTGLRSGMTNLGAGVGTMILPGVGTAIGAAAGNAFGYGLKGNGWKNKAVLAAMGPIGWTALAAKAAGVPIIHKTTGQRQIEATGDFLKQGKDDATWQNYVQGMRGNYGTPGAKPKGNAFHGGDYATWEDYQKAGLDAADLTGVAGNLKTYGPQWSHLTDDQRRQITQANINSGVYKSSKGDVGITDANIAKQNYDNVLGGKGVMIPKVNSGPQAISQSTAANLTGATQAPQIDAGTLKRWRTQKQPMIPRTGR